MEKDPQAYSRVGSTLPEARRVLLSRDRVLRLDQGAPVIVIEGPSGYGKTVLAEMWLDRQRRTSMCCWVSLDAADADPVVFLEKLLRAVGADYAGIADSGADDEAGRADRFGSVTNRLTDEDESFCIVFDDVHTLQEAQSLEYLQSIIQLASARVRICLTMQPRELELGLGQLTSKGRALWIDAKVLALQKVEVGTFARQRGQELSPDQLDWLYNATEGWPALTQLALAVPLDCQAMASSELVGSGPLRAYIYERFVSGLSADEQDILWMLACLGSAPVAMLAALDATPAKVDLALLRFRSLGIVRHRDPDEGTVVTLHALIRESVATHLRNNDAPRREALFRDACFWYWRIGQGPEAVRLALEGGSSLAPQAKQWMIELGFAFIFRSGQHQNFLDLAETWEALTGQTDPGIDETAAWALIFLKRFSLAEERLKRMARSEHANHALMVELQQAVLRALSDDYSEAARLARRWMDCNPGRQDYEMGVACTVFAFSQKFLAKFDESQIALRDAMHCFDKAQSGYGIGWAHVVGGLCLVQAGRYRAALAQAEAGLQRCPALHGYGSLRALLRGIEAFVRYERNEIPQMREVLDEALPLLADQGIVDGVSLGYTAAARARAAVSDFGTALDILTEGEEVGQKRQLPRLTRLLSIERALLLVRSGSVSRALALIDQLATAAPGRVAIGLLRARVSLSAGDAATAIESLQPIIERTRRQGRQSRLCEALIQLALAEEQARRDDSAFAAYAEALDIGNSEGYFRMFVDEGAALMTLNARILQEGGIPSRSAVTLADKLSEWGNSASQPAKLELEFGLTLNKRERQIIALLNEGLSNSQISQRCFISQGTVKWYMHNLFEKFGVTSRTSLLRDLREKGLI